MAIKGLTLSAVSRYISPADPAYKPDLPVAEQIGCTVAVLGPLDVFVNTYIRDLGQTVENGEFQVDLYRMELETVRFGLRELHNFETGEGAMVTVQTVPRSVLGRTYHVVSDDTLAQLPAWYVAELSAEVRKISTVTEAEAKN